MRCARRFSAAPPAGCVVGTAGWPPGLHVFNGFGAPTPEMASGVVSGARALIAAVEATARGDAAGPRSAAIPQPTRSQAHNLAAEREFVPLRVHDPALHEGAAILRCEHFSEYGSRYHALSYFRGNENLPRVLDPILAALRELDVVRALGHNARGGGARDGGGGARDGGGDELGLHWKLTLNHYKPRARDARVRAARRPRGRRRANARHRRAGLARAPLGPRALGVGAPRGAAPRRGRQGAHLARARLRAQGDRLLLSGARASAMFRSEVNGTPRTPDPA